MARRALPARAGDECARKYSYQGSLDAQTTPVPGPPSSHGLSNGVVVQNSTPTRAWGQWAAEGELSIKSIPASKTGVRNLHACKNLACHPAHLSRVVQGISLKMILWSSGVPVYKKIP